MFAFLIFSLHVSIVEKDISNIISHIFHRRLETATNTGLKFIEVNRLIVTSAYYRLTGTMNCSISHYYSSEDRFFQNIRHKFSAYDDGSITCNKDEETGVAEICIKNSTKKNAISGKMMIDFESIVIDLEEWSSGKGVLLYGDGGMFCSGGDLEFVTKENNPDSGYEMSFYMTKTLNRLAALPLVSVTYINGNGALGGGAEISTATDFRVMSNSAKTRIGFVHTVMGIIPAWGGLARLVQIVGKPKALNLILSANLLSAQEAVAVGLVDEIVDDSLDAARQWLLHRVRHDGDVVRATKLCIAKACEIDEHVIINERCVFAPLFGGPANKTALAAKKKHM